MRQLYRFCFFLFRPMSANFRNLPLGLLPACFSFLFFLSFLFFFARMCLKRKSEKTKIARPKINNQKCPPCGRTSNYRKSWAPRPQQLETPRLTLGKIRRETSLEPESVPQKYHCYQLWYSLLPGADTCLVSAPAQNCVTHVQSSFVFRFTTAVSYIQVRQTMPQAIERMHLDLS